MDKLIECKYKPSQIRQRISYSFWKGLTKKVKHANCTEEIIRLIWECMDERMMFSTHKQSCYEAESAEMALSDVLECE